MSIYAACAVRVTIFSIGSKFWPVSNFTELHALTQTRSYALLLCMMTKMYCCYSNQTHLLLEVAMEVYHCTPVWTVHVLLPPFPSPPSVSPSPACDATIKRWQPYPTDQIITMTAVSACNNLKYCSYYFQAYVKSFVHIYYKAAKQQVIRIKNLTYLVAIIPNWLMSS